MFIADCGGDSIEIRRDDAFGWRGFFDFRNDTDACFAPVLDMHEALVHPHNLARGTFVDVEGLMQPAPAPRFSRTSGQIRNLAPQAGADTLTILEGLGLEASVIDGLQRNGAVYVR